MLVYMGGRTNALIEGDNPAPEGTYYDPTTDESVYIPPGELAYYYGEGLESGAGVAGEFTETEYDKEAWTADNLLPDHSFDTLYDPSSYLNDIGNLDHLDLNTQIKIEHEVNSFINDVYSGF